jgi:TrmH family RNA methyltransferase
VTRAVRSANAEFQVWQALLVNRQTRNREGAFIVQGVRNIDAALAHRWTVRTALTTARHHSPWARGVLDRVDDVVELPRPLFDELAEREDPPELLLIVAKRTVGLEVSPSFIGTVLDRPSSPGNIGTIIRTTDALGGDAVMITGHGADPYDPRCVRASTGSFFAVPVVEVPNADALHALRLTLVATDEEGDASLDEIPGGPLALRFGNETTGLSRGLREAADRTVAIPMRGSASSLNVAAAHAIVLYAVSTRRG